MNEAELLKWVDDTQIHDYYWYVDPDKLRELFTGMQLVPASSTPAGQTPVAQAAMREPSPSGLVCYDLPDTTIPIRRNMVHEIIAQLSMASKKPYPEDYTQVRPGFEAVDAIRNRLIFLVKQAEQIADTAPSSAMKEGQSGEGQRDSRCPPAWLVEQWGIRARTILTGDLEQLLYVAGKAVEWANVSPSAQEEKPAEAVPVAYPDIETCKRWGDEVFKLSMDRACLGIADGDATCYTHVVCKAIDWYLANLHPAPPDAGQGMVPVAWRFKNAGLPDFAWNYHNGFTSETEKVLKESNDIGNVTEILYVWKKQ